MFPPAEIAVQLDWQDQGIDDVKKSYFESRALHLEWQQWHCKGADKARAWRRLSTWFTLARQVLSVATFLWEMLINIHTFIQTDDFCCSTTQQKERVHNSLFPRRQEVLNPSWTSVVCMQTIKLFKCSWWMADHHFQSEVAGAACKDILPVSAWILSGTSTIWSPSPVECRTTSISWVPTNTTWWWLCWDSWHS